MSFKNLILLLSVLTLFACKKEEKITGPPMEQQELNTCHYAENWDSSIITDKLIGTWNWEYVSCYWTPQDANGTEQLGLSLHFKQNGTLEVKENGTLTQTSTWTVVDADVDNNYALQLDPPYYLLSGHLLFCNDLVEFFDSYIDGCDNYYRKEG